MNRRTRWMYSLLLGLGLKSMAARYVRRLHEGTEYSEDRIMKAANRDAATPVGRDRPRVGRTSRLGGQVAVPGPFDRDRDRVLGVADEAQLGVGLLPLPGDRDCLAGLHQGLPGVRSPGG